MKQLIAALDLGGTFLKGCLFDENIAMVGDIQLSPIDSRGSKEVVISTMLSFLERLIAGNTITRIAVSTPGPFYYEQGYSGQTDKYGSINGIQLRPIIREGLNLPEDLPIDFVSDSNSFLIGESLFGEGIDCMNLAVITLGTGLGYSAMQNGRIVTNMRGRPYDLPSQDKWNGTILDDICSGRGLALSYFKMTGKQTTAREMANQPDDTALFLFQQMGEILGKYLKKYTDMREIKRLIVGGQVSKAFKLFKQPLCKGLNGVEVCVAKNIDSAALYGVAAYSMNMVKPWDRHEE